MSLHPKVTPRATRELERMNGWWARERPAAPTLFADELEAAIDLLVESPHLGLLYAGGRPGTRRFLLTQARAHVYYAVRGDDLLLLSVWSALRNRGPHV